MSDAIKAYNSMSEFYASMGGTLKQDVDFTIHQLEVVHNNVPIESPLFRANYYSILLIRKGRGRYILDGQSYEIKDRTIYFTNPGHVKGFKIYELSHGYVITFSETFLKQYVHENIFDDFPFLIAEIVPPHYPGREVFQIFDDLGTQLLQEYQSDSAYKFKIIGSLTVVLLFKIKEQFWNTYNPLAESQTGSEIVMTFKRNLEAHFRDLAMGKLDRPYRVQDFAQAQHLHPAYLSTVIKSKTGKSVNAWMIEKTLSEAQAMLSRSTESVQEIAFRLGFNDAAYFSRFFKKHTATTPSSFRQSLKA
ncbi:helix-turn-helix transcriptional regulator [Chroococcidiopsis sp. FACHB-1243]|uniref:helix-turn-helix domain-containing protein n=1 Tax=Chroococcidiopsis sp. [FACHB-1243] TaxID=2692781 RepID=UPI00178565F1|nr:AraC family transcriptional regulator [Chroococcidiopsis sp. [FACHB-1243]]MBD2304442.1 helix-turn-helix transcriptional regulator [Chroococcidiopsis sp. [FACHB-1243]]